MFKRRNYMEDINILVTIDKNYIDPLLVMMNSYARFHESYHTNLFIIHRTLETKHINYISEKLASFNISVKAIKVENSYFKGIPLLERIPMESFDRIIAFKYLPNDVDKCLYLDPDILINKSIMPLYDMDISESYIAAATHINFFVNFLNRLRLLLKDQKTYINSGVVLMNLKKMREDFTIEDIQKTLKKFVRVLFLGDQDMMNILYGPKCIILDDAIYNLDEKAMQHHHMSLDAVKEKTIFIHYNGKFKPWLKGYHGKLDVLYPEVTNKGPAPRGMMAKQIISSLKILWPSFRYFFVDLCIILFILLLILLLIKICF